MYTIKLRTAFNGKNANDIFKKLVTKNEDEYCIIYEKTFLYEKNLLSSGNIGIDYMLAAYAGQKLAQVTDNFTYFVPAPNTKDPYKFEFTVTTLEELADTLCYIGYTSDEQNGDADAESRFMDDAIQWINNVKFPHTEVACYGLYHIANHPPKVWVLF